MTIIVNGTQRAVDDGANVAAVVADLGAESRGVAVAVNGEVVPRGRWSSHGLRAGDRVEVLGAAQGG